MRIIIDSLARLCVVGRHWRRVSLVGIRRAIMAVHFENGKFNAF